MVSALSVLTKEEFTTAGTLPLTFALDANEKDSSAASASAGVSSFPLWIGGVTSSVSGSEQQNKTNKIVNTDRRVLHSQLIEVFIFFLSETKRPH
jgi:hypothetical protein